MPWKARARVRFAAAFAAALAVSGFSTAAAQAEPFGLELDQGVMDIGPLVSNAAVLEPGGPKATLTGEIDPATGAFSVPVSGFVFPSKEVSVSGIPVTIDLSVNDPINGTFNSTTGAMSVPMSVKAKIKSVPLGLDCTISPVPLTFVTGGQLNPTHPGSPFAPATTSGAGALVATWSSLPAAVPPGSPGCTDLDALTAGAGGIWLARGASGSAPVPNAGSARLALSVSPGKASAKVGKGATFTADVTNTGDGDAAGVQVCVEAAKVKGTGCQQIGALARGAGATAEFTLKPTKKAKKSVKVSFEATGDGLNLATAEASLKVKTKKKRK